MSGEVSFDFRLSPSGPLIQDAVSGVPQQFGTGTPGLVWRGQFVGAPLDISGVTPILVPGMGGAWAMPAGYHYEIVVGLQINATVGQQGDLVICVEHSHDGGLSWTTIFQTTVTGTLLATSETRNYFAGRMSYQPGLDITNVRVLVCGGTTTRSLYQGWIKAEQYVL
jgi:hypothetical protein